MKQQDVKLTLHETEQFCRLYMDCRLTVLEEIELQYVLEKIPDSSPCIDEVRLLMGITTRLNIQDPFKRNPVWFNFSRVVRVAVSVIIFFAIGIAFLNHQIENENSTSEIYIAYSNGERLKGDLSIQQVKSDIEQADKFLSHIERLEAQEMAQLEHFLNKIEQ